MPYEVNTAAQQPLRKSAQRPVDLTELWRKGEDESIRFKSVPSAIETKQREDLPEDALIGIQGWASTPDLDAYNDVVEPEAFRSSLTAYMEKGTMLYMHDWWGIPVGKFFIARIEADGLWVEGYIMDTSDGRDVAIALKHGTLNALSIGFRTKNFTYDKDTDIRTIHDLELFEISIVHVGANPAALMSVMKDAKEGDKAQFVTKSLQSLTASLGGIDANHKESEMADDKKVPDFEAKEVLNKAEKLVGDVKTSLEEKLSEGVGDLHKKIGDVAAAVNAVKEEQEKFAKGAITDAEFHEKMDKMVGDIAALNEDVRKFAKAREIAGKKMPFCEWKSSPEAMITPRSEEGQPLSPTQASAHKLMQIPVKYEGEDGQLLKTIRQLNDVVVLSSKYGLRPTQLKSYGMLRELIGQANERGMVDDEFKSVMYSTGTNLGDEWVPDQWSSELHDLFELEAVVAGAIPQFTMPSNPFNWPLLKSRPTVYRAGEPANNNPSLLAASTMGTNKVTFTAETFAVNVPATPQLMEDSIIAIAPAIRMTTARALAHAEDSRIINGDSSSTHQDNATTTLYASTAPETYEKGLRRFGTDDSTKFNVQSTTSGYGDGAAALTVDDLLYLRTLGGKVLTPMRSKWLTSVNGLTAIMKIAAFNQPGTYNAGQAYADGQLVTILNSPLLVSEDVPVNLNAAGIYDGTTTTQTVIILFNPDELKLGRRREITVEVDKEVQQQLIYFVSTYRSSFQKMSASTITPVAVGYNVKW